MSVKPLVISSLVVDPNYGSTDLPVLTIISATSFAIYEQKPANLVDAGNVPITWSLETGFTTNEDGSLFTFAALMLRAAIKADPNLETPDVTIRVEFIPLDSTTPVFEGNITPTDRPGQWYSILTDFVAEHVRIKLSGHNQLLLNRLVEFVSKRAEQRPR